MALLSTRDGLTRVTAWCLTGLAIHLHVGEKMGLKELDRVFEVVDVPSGTSPEFPLGFASPMDKPIVAAGIVSSQPMELLDIDYITVECDLEYFDLPQLPFELFKLAIRKNNNATITLEDCENTSQLIAVMRTVIRRQGGKLTHVLVRDAAIPIPDDNLEVIQTNALKPGEVIGLDNHNLDGFVCVKHDRKYGLAILNIDKVFYGTLNGV